MRDHRVKKLNNVIYEFNAWEEFEQLVINVAVGQWPTLFGPWVQILSYIKIKLK